MKHGRWEQGRTLPRGRGLEGMQQVITYRPKWPKAADLMGCSAFSTTAGSHCVHSCLHEKALTGSWRKHTLIGNPDSVDSSRFLWASTEVRLYSLIPPEKRHDIQTSKALKVKMPTKGLLMRSMT